MLGTTQPEFSCETSLYFLQVYSENASLGSLMCSPPPGGSTGAVLCLLPPELEPLLALQGFPCAQGIASLLCRVCEQCDFLSSALEKAELVVFLKKAGKNIEA